MNTKKHSEKFLRHRKFMLVLPVLVLPFIALIFWSFGGGRGNTTTGKEVVDQQGLNTQLPDAVLKDDPSLTKMSFYDQAASDSLKRFESMKSDPFYQLGKVRVDSAGMQEYLNGALTPPITSHTLETASGISTFKDPNEAKVYSRIEALNQAMSQASGSVPERAKDYQRSATPAPSAVKSADLDRLEDMMNVMKSSSGGEDPETKQLNGMLDKIMDIQHPDRVTTQVAPSSSIAGSKVLPVIAKTGEDKISILQSPYRSGTLVIGKQDTLVSPPLTGFYSLELVKEDNRSPNAISAAVHETQSLVSGATVKMRLLSDITINGELIPKDNFIYGTAAISDERLKITIASIRYQNSIFPVRLSVYDMDGMEGIYMPGSISRDAAKTSTDQALQGVGLPSLSPSLPVQAAGAGIQAAKSLLSKKAKLVKVSVKAGYQILLKGADL